MTTKEFNRFIKLLMKNKELIPILEDLINSGYLTRFKPTIKVELEEANIKYMVSISDGGKSQVLAEDELEDSDFLNQTLHMFRDHLDSDYSATSESEDEDTV